MLRPAADHRVHQDYISDHLELTGERKEEEEASAQKESGGGVCAYVNERWCHGNCHDVTMSLTLFT